MEGASVFTVNSSRNGTGRRIFDTFDSTFDENVEPGCENNYSKYLPYLLCVFIISFVVNGLILTAICISKRFCRPVNYMLANLVCTSSLRVISSIGVYMVKYGKLQFHSVWSCKLYSATWRLPVAAEGFSVMCISLDRSKAARNPWDRETSQRALRKILCIWLASFAVECPQGLFWELETVSESSSVCYKSRKSPHMYQLWVAYIAMHYVLTNLIPSLVMGKELRRLISAFKFLQSNCAKGMSTVEAEEHAKSTCKEHKRLTRNAIIFTFTFILINLPVATWYALYELPPDLISHSFRQVLISIRPAMFVTAFLLYTLYPILVFSLSSDFRHYCKHFFRNRLSQGED